MSAATHAPAPSSRPDRDLRPAAASPVRPAVRATADAEEKADGGVVFDAIVVGGGPAGATAAQELARAGWRVMLLDRGGRPKPCGGAVPPRLLQDYAIPDALLVARARCARMVAPSGRQVDIPIEGGFVGLVDRGPFDEWLRERAAAAGAERVRGRFVRLDPLARDPRDPQAARYVLHWESIEAPGVSPQARQVRTRCVVGADGARSAVARQVVPGAEEARSVFAYHEIVRAPDAAARAAGGARGYDPARCDVVYQGRLSPDFYGWVFPHGETCSVGTGSADKGFSLRAATAALREQSGLAAAPTLRREGAPLPMKPLRRWDDGVGTVLAGDAAGVVAPASGEGIYYAMVGGTLAAEAVSECLRSGRARALARVRRRFLRAHGRVFWVLGIMQRFWYRDDRRRERFVSLCRDRDVQQLTFDAYMNKRLVRARPLAHVRIFFKDMAHLLGLARV